MLYRLKKLEQSSPDLLSNSSLLEKLTSSYKYIKLEHSQMHLHGIVIFIFLVLVFDYNTQDIL